MKRIILVLIMIFLCCGCDNISDEPNSKTSMKGENIEETISNTIRWEELQKITKKDRIVQNADYIFVYDITDYVDENLNYQYQYFIYNDDGTILIDRGIQGANGYAFEKYQTK